MISASFQHVKETYFNWQGTYAAIFIFSIQPAAFSENFYFLTTLVMLFSLICSTAIFINTVFTALGYNKRYGLFISCIILLLSIHFVVNKNEAFFWWNGCSYYTVFYSFSLLLFSLLIKLYFTDKRSVRIMCFIISSFLAFLIGGGNYSTALITTVIFVFTLCFVIKQRKQLLVYYLLTFSLLITGFVISVVAPGNSVRANLVTGTSPIKAVFLSVYHSIQYIAKWTGLSQIAGFIIIAVIAFLLTSKSNFSFRYPFAVLIISILVFATQLTPPLYAMGTDGSGRQVNIYYYSYYLLVTANIFYCCGWLNKRNLIKINVNGIKKKSYVLSCMLLIVGLFLGGCLNYRIDNITFGDTVLALMNGTPQKYSQEYEEIIVDIKNGKKEINDIQTLPDFFGPLRIADREDSEYWLSVIQQYYNVNDKNE